MTERKNALEQWLRMNCGQEFVTLQPMPGDASFRRYFRIHTKKGSFVVMDAEPPREDCRSYIAIANSLRHIGLHVPDIFHAEEEQGFLLLTDFGDMTYLKALNNQNADQLYTIALHALVTLQTCQGVAEKPIPFFTSHFMWQEWQWCKEWFLGKWLDLSLGKEEKHLDDCYALIVESAVSQPQVFMHRDFHSANLMVLPNTQVGILDFQDALIGPVTYDVVSLLRDCYIEWPDDLVREWVLEYWNQSCKAGIVQNVNQAVFLKWFDWMGIERHLKVLFTFARKHVRDGQSSYLKHIPQALNYLLHVSACYAELAPLHRYFAHVVQPALQEAKVEA